MEKFFWIWHYMSNIVTIFYLIKVFIFLRHIDYVKKIKKQLMELNRYFHTRYEQILYQEVVIEKKLTDTVFGNTTIKYNSVAEFKKVFLKLVKKFLLKLEKNIVKFDEKENYLICRNTLKGIIQKMQDDNDCIE